MTASTVVLSADLGGVVREVLLDGPGVGFAAGEPLEAHVDEGSRAKLRRFLEEVERRGSAVDWQIGFDGGAVRVLAVSAARRDGRLVCVAGRPRGRVAQLAARELAAERAERAPELDEALRELARAESARKPEADVLEDMSSVVNELITLQRENARKAAELARSNDEKDRLLSTVAHDLRNPLATALGYSHLLLTGAAGELSAAQEKLVRAIERSSQHMLALVESLVDWTALPGGVRLELAEYDLVDQVRCEIELQRVLADRKSITLELSGETALSVRADRTKMRQVVQNVLDNAIKYSHPGGRVLVRVVLEAGWACVSFRDEGVGIPPGALARMFQPFGRGAARGTAGEKSTGLGLAIVRRIVEAHGGRIEVQSELGEGSTFTVRIPTGGPG